MVALNNESNASPFEKKRILTHDNRLLDPQMLDGSPALSLSGEAGTSNPLQLHPENDAGNARLLIDRFGNELRFVHAFDSWLIWDGTRWRRDEDGGIQRFALQLSQRLLSDAGKIADHKQRAAVAERALRLGNTAKSDQCWI
jgi:hypothetical protein